MFAVYCSAADSIIPFLGHFTDEGVAEEPSAKHVELSAGSFLGDLVVDALEGVGGVIGEPLLVGLLEADIIAVVGAEDAPGLSLHCPALLSQVLDKLEKLTKGVV